MCCTVPQTMFTIFWTPTFRTVYVQFSKFCNLSNINPFGISKNHQPHQLKEKTHLPNTSDLNRRTSRGGLRDETSVSWVFALLALGISGSLGVTWTLGYKMCHDKRRSGFFAPWKRGEKPVGTAENIVTSLESHYKNIQKP